MDEEEIQQRLEDFKEWRPTPRQEDFLAVPPDVFEVLYGGALGGGKTDALITLPIVTRCKRTERLLYQHPEFTGIIFRRTYKQLEKKVIPRAKQIYGALGAKYNETSKCFRFPSGAKIFLGHMEHESDVFQHDTNEYQYVGIDQAEQFTEFQLRYIPSRIRTSNQDLPTLYRLAANPGGESHTYLRDRFVKPCKQGGVILQEKITGLKRIYIPAKLEDNPFLMLNDPDYINRLSLLPEAEREAKRSGDWFSFAGQRFSEFRVKHYPGEPENAIHVIPRFTIPQFWPKLISIDWGWSAQTFAIWYALSPLDDRVYIYRCYGIKKSTIRQWGSDVARLSQHDGNIVRVVLDSACWNEQGLGITQASEFYESIRGSLPVPEKSDKDRHSGVSLIHEFLRWIPKPPKFIPPEGFNPEVANRILRMSGPNGYNEYVNSFQPEEPEKNLPKLQILLDPKDIHTQTLIDAMQNAQYDEKDKEDYAEYDGDDPLDSLRYGLKASNIWIENAKKTQSLLIKEAEINKDLETTGDMHSYYMRMAKLDADRKKLNPKPVLRYH